MKFSLSLALVVLMIMPYMHAAWSPFVFQNQHDMLEYMRDEDHHVYVLFLYNSQKDAQGVDPHITERMGKIVVQERNLVKEHILESFDNIKYAELDLAGGKWDEVCHEIGIETDDALEYPILVMVDDGLGKWVHGPDLIQLAVPVVRALVERNSQ